MIIKIISVQNIVYSYIIIISIIVIETDHNISTNWAHRETVFCPHLAAHYAAFYMNAFVLGALYYV